MDVQTSAAKQLLKVECNIVLIYNEMKKRYTSAALTSLYDPHTTHSIVSYSNFSDSGNYLSLFSIDNKIVNITSGCGETVHVTSCLGDQENLLWLKLNHWSPNLLH